MSLYITKASKLKLLISRISAKTGIGLACLLLLTQSACGQGASNARRLETESDHGRELREANSASLRNWKELAEKFGMLDAINDSLEEIKQDTCFHDSPDYKRDCADQFEEVRFADGEFEMEKSTEEAILVGEEGVDPLLPITRYRGRTKAFYSVENGKLVNYSKSVRLPRTLLNISKRFTGPKFYPAHALEVLSEAIDETYPGFEFDYAQHNTAIIEIIYEYNPHSPVVAIDGLGDVGRLFDKNAVCGEDSIEQKTMHMKLRSIEFSRMLANIIETDNIRYASLSFGIWHSATRNNLRRLCKNFSLESSELEKITAIAIKSLKPIFEVLGKNPKLLTAQSAPYPGNKGPYDCNPDLRNILFVGSLNKPNSHFLSDGSGLPEKDYWTRADSFQKMLKVQFETRGECAHIYVNFSLLRDKDLPDTLMASLGFGMGMGRIGHFASTSEAAPLGLSKIIYLRQTAEFKDRTFDQSLIGDLKDAATPKSCPDLPNQVCIFQDPLKYRQTSIHSHLYW